MSGRSRPPSQIILVAVVVTLLYAVLNGCSAAPTDSTATTTDALEKPASEYVWTDVTPSAPDSSPAPRFSAWFLADSTRGRVLLYGGFVRHGEAWGRYGDLWEWEPETHTWRPRTVIDAPLVDAGTSAMALDEGRGVLVLVAPGGPQGQGAPTTPELTTLELDPNEGRWETISTSGLPSYRFGACMAYVSRTATTVLFGGYGDVFLNDTWAYDGATGAWTDLDPEGPWPPARTNASLVYDSTVDRLILFGGMGETGLLNDIWSYDPQQNTWLELSPPGCRPAPRVGAALAFDPAARRVILVGGSDSPSPITIGSGGARQETPSTVMGDTWIYDMAANTWTELSLVPAPPARAYAALGRDPATGSLILFGGYGPDGLLGDSWVGDPSEASGSRGAEVGS